MLLSILLLSVVAIWLITVFWLRGSDHSEYDQPRPTPTGTRDAPSPAHADIVRGFEDPAFATAANGDRRQQLANMREFMDNMGADINIDGRIEACNAGGVPGEWVVHQDAAADRCMLYIHGGAFTMGSPQSHRAITTEYSKCLGVAVLAIDYRLMPEHPRRASIEDCRTAYRWLLENTPTGPGAPSEILISGDSAGGNLTLMLIAWIRDEGLRAPDAAIALSPATDSTFGSPSLQTNLDTDPMLAPMMRPFLKMPKFLRLWVGWLTSRIRPAAPEISPLLDNLANLPPTLVHASSAELLFDDAVRYVNKARGQGSAVEIGVWPFMVHVWHAFVRQLPEAREAFDHIESFVSTQRRG